MLGGRGRITKSSIVIRYLLVLALLGSISVSFHFAFHHLLGEQQNYGYLINLSGQQRMLSQRIERLVDRLLVQDDAKERETLRNAARLMEEGHNRLTDPVRGRLSEPLLEIYHGTDSLLDADVRRFLHHAFKIADLPSGALTPEHPYIRSFRLVAASELLGRLNAVVRQYQQESEIAVSKLNTLKFWEVLISLAALLLSGTLVFQPLVVRITNDIQTLSEAHTRLRGTLDSALDAIITIDADGHILAFNRSAEFLFGYRFTDVEGRDIAELLIPPESRLLHRQGLRRVLEAQDSGTLGVRRQVLAMRSDGTRIPVELTITTFEANGRLLLTSFIRDLSERRRTEEELNKLSCAVEQSPAAVIITNTTPQIEYVNSKFVDLFGFEAYEVLGQHPRIINSSENSKDVYRDLLKIISSGKEWRGELHQRRKDGSTFWSHMTISPIRSNEGEITHYVAVTEDLTERKDYEERLLRQASYDELTELPNRLLGLDRIAHEVSRAQQTRHLLAVMIIDLDRFKHINETLGHAVGNQIILAAASRLRSCTNEAMTLARLGGDEFLLAIPDLSTPQQAEEVAQAIVEGFAATPLIQTDDYDLTVTTSIGITFFPTDGESSAALIQNSEAAMYKAKEAGRNTYRFFVSEMNRQLLDHLAIETRLRSALERQELFLHFQPMVSVDDGSLVGAEVLLRWHNPELGTIPPDRFIPVAEMSGLIIPIGAWVLQQACQQLLHWREIFPYTQHLKIAVNVSARQIRLPQFIKDVANILHETGLPPNCLELEITESLLIDDERETLRRLQELADLGVLLSIDDFGTGYSSLRYLKAFPVKILKIDRSFIRGAGNNPDSSALVEAMIAMAHGLGLKVVAEGVEEDRHVQFLRHLRCDIAQGYFFGRPVPAIDFERHIRNVAHPSALSADVSPPDLPPASAGRKEGLPVS